MLRRAIRPTASRLTAVQPAFTRASLLCAPRVRQLALGPAVGGEVSDELLQKLSTLSTQVRLRGSDSQMVPATLFHRRTRLCCCMRGSDRICECA